MAENAHKPMAENTRKSILRRALKMPEKSAEKSPVETPQNFLRRPVRLCYSLSGYAGFPPGAKCPGGIENCRLLHSLPLQGVPA